jgi:hypothetical protein
MVFFREIGDQHPLTIEHKRRPTTMHYYRPRRNNALIIYGLLVLFFVLPLVICRLISSRMNIDFIIIHFCLCVFINRTIRG